MYAGAPEGEVGVVVGAAWDVVVIEQRQTRDVSVETVAQGDRLPQDGRRHGVWCQKVNLRHDPGSYEIFCYTAFSFRL